MIHPVPRPSLRAALAVLAFAVAWGVGPALPPLLRGELPGQPYTDLYPSVWGLGVFADLQPGLPTWTDRLGAPEGAGFYYSSPLHGWIGAPICWLFGAVAAYDFTLLAARAATVLAAFACFREAGLGVPGALAAAGVYGASPFFHGYAVEGIVEGTDGWPLPLWAWLVLRRSRLAPVAFLLLVVASWYLAMVGCLLALGWGVRRREAWLSAGLGLLLACPFLVAFLGAFHPGAPLDDEVRRAMGATLRIPRPGALEGLNVFAMNAYVGFAVVLLALPAATSSPALVAGALACAVLSTGIGPWYDLPILEAVRFPYRWHAGTLFCLAPMVGRTVDGLRWRWLGALPVVEGLLLSPVEPILPGASAQVPAIYAEVRGPILLEVPGPVAMAPGVVNRSRKRSSYVLFAQLTHRAASPWRPDFNGLATAEQPAWLATFAAWDPLVKGAPGMLDLVGARAAGVTQVMAHRDELGANADGFERELADGGAVQVAVGGPLTLWDL
jgi:hypothetical protein